MKALTLNLPDDVYRKLTCVAEENDISLPALLTHQVVIHIGEQRTFFLRRL